ncbi:MAG: PIN domain-containing protein [Candidatus Bathyarchaeia archaeon]
MSRAAIDTSVIIEYIDEMGGLHREAETLFKAVLTGKLEAIIPHPILVETYYVASRLYRQLGVTDTQSKSQRLIERLYRLPQASIIGEGLGLVVEAGKAKLNYNLALTDCYILAASKIYNCKAVFKRVEEEMLRKIDDLKRDYQILFLEAYK